MITKAIPPDTKPALMLSFSSNTDNEYNFGAPSTPYYIYNWKHDLTNIDQLLLFTRGGKLSDLSADNTLKLIIGSTTENTSTYATGAEYVNVDWIDVSGYTGVHKVKLYVEGGTDQQFFEEIYLVGLYS